LRNLDRPFCRPEKAAFDKNRSEKKRTDRKIIKLEIKMTRERWRQIDEVFAAVLEVPETERENFLDRHCRGDEELKREVLKLLELQPRADRFLEVPAMKLAAKKLSEAETIVDEHHLSGKKIGTYKIERPLGAGGMGEVYLATDEKLKRNVALKILPAEYMSSDERVKRFELEARAISILNHPNIVTIYDLGGLDGISYIATEFVEGVNLREMVGRRPSIREILDIIIQVCDALAAAHRAGIIHRDIKPENVMVRPDGYVKVLDFGLAKLSGAMPHLSGDFAKTAGGIVIGTPAYMSPKQVAGDSVDQRTDLWSVGVVLYELLTGVNPFKKENRQRTFQAILLEDAPPASSFNPEISSELDRILMKALEKDADLSYQTAADLRADLRRVRREVDTASSPNFSAPDARKTAANSYYARFAAGLLVFAALAFGFWHFARRSKTPAVAEATEWNAGQNLQLTDSPWVEGYPSLSPDGKNIIFASEVEGDGNIYMQRVGGKTQTNLTPNSPRRDTMPAFSPDGRLIAFRSERDAGGIYIMEETGENARRISDFGYHPSWSPDSKKIVVSDKASSIHTAYTIPNGSLWTIDTATGEKRKLETGGDAIMPSWSPNGHRIAFWSVAGGSSGEIVTVPADGGAPTVIASDEAADWNPVWSPDGKYVYFASNRGGNMNIWRVPVDEKTGRQTGEPEAVSTPARYCRHLTISRDGKLLGYVRYESKSNLRSIAFDPKTLKTVGEADWITRGNIEISNPQLSPDGEEFLVRNPTNSQEDLSIFDKGGGHRRALTNDRFLERSPRWLPDGKRIAFHSDRSGKFQIWTINADGSNPEQITFTEKTGAVDAVFSADGKHLIYTEIDGETRRPVRLDLTKRWSEQTPQPLAAVPLDGADFSARDWSKDGRKLLGILTGASDGENGIAVFDFAAASYEKLTDAGGFPFWLNDSRHFIFTSQRAVFLGDAETKKITELYRAPAYELQQANISPDNQLLFFRYLEVEADVWLVDASGER
jgi:serine/threonine protein kinase